MQTNNTNNNIEKDTNDVFKNDMEVIINTMEAQDDSRMKNSKFLSFIKDLNNGTTSFDSTNNTIISSQPHNNNDNNVDTTTQQNKNDPYQQMNNVWNSISSQIDSLHPHLLSLSPSQYLPEAQKYLDAHDYSTGISLLNSYLQYTTSNNSPSLESIHTLSKTYMDIIRSDLALSTLTQNTSLISNHIPSLLLLSMCYANEGEDYKAISTLLSILSLPKYNQLSSIESNLYLNKSFIEQHLNPDNIDMTNTLSYRTYEQHKQNLYKELSTIFETLLQSEQFKNDCDILSSYGILNMIHEHINKAEALFSKVTTLNKNDYTT